MSPSLVQFSTSGRQIGRVTEIPSATMHGGTSGKYDEVSLSRTVIMEGEGALKDGILMGNFVNDDTRQWSCIVEALFLLLVRKSILYQFFKPKCTYLLPSIPTNAFKLDSRRWSTTSIPALRCRNFIFSPYKCIYHVLAPRKQAAKIPLRLNAFPVFQTGTERHHHDWWRFLPTYWRFFVRSFVPPFICLNWSLI